MNMYTKVRFRIHEVKDVYSKVGFCIYEVGI